MIKEGEMKGLMFDCKNWGEPHCNTDVRKFKLASEHEEWEETEIYPMGEELRKLDEICKECEFLEL